MKRLFDVKVGRFYMASRRVHWLVCKISIYFKLILILNQSFRETFKLFNFIDEYLLR